MAPRKRVGRRKGLVPQTPSSTQAPNSRGFATLADLADEMYLEILSYIPSVPIPTVTESPLHPEIRRSRHETLLALSQTSRSLRRFFWRYLWQRIEVRQGMKIRDEEDDSKDTPYLGSETGEKRLLKKYNIELVRQLEVVTVRNPQLAQYVNYLDVFIDEYSLKTVLAELARFQIDVTYASKESLDKIFTRTFKEYSYPQIRNVSIMTLSRPFLASCPEARRVSMIRRCAPYLTNGRSYLEFMAEKCPHLEVLEDFPELYQTIVSYYFIVRKFPNLRIIMIEPAELAGRDVDTLNELNSLETIIFFWRSSNIPHLWYQQAEEEWIQRLKRVLIQVGLRDNLEKTLVIKDTDGERKIAIKPVQTSKEV